MKKSLILLCFSVIMLSGTCQTGTGWKQVTTKQNFAADINVAKGFLIGGLRITATGAEINMIHGRTVTGVELDYVHGVTSNIQTQLNAKASLTSPHFNSGYIIVGTDTLATRPYARSVAIIDTAGGAKGSVAWGGVTGDIATQSDLIALLNAKAPLASPQFTGSVTGITAAMVGAMSISHPANVITNTYITNWTTAYNWGNHASAGYALVSALSGYVPATRTVNGHALSSNTAVTATDLSLGNVNNTSDANKPVSTATQTALNLKANIANPTFTTGITTPAITIGATTLTATGAELNFVHGVTSNIQSQFDNSQIITDNVIISTTDTTVSASVGRIVFKSSDTHFYGCRKITGKKWYQLD